jgi:hypothetical protein
MPRYEWPSLVSACLLSVSLAGCAGDDYATGEEVLAVCHEYQDAACRAFAVCLGASEPEVAACMETGRSRCRQGIGAVTCWDQQRAALDDCAADVAEESCESLCNAESCSHQCDWLCPEAAPDS